MPFSLLPREAEAQFNSSSSFGVSGYVRGLAPAIAKLPQCKEEIGSGIKNYSVEYLVVEKQEDQ